LLNAFQTVVVESWIKATGRVSRAFDDQKAFSASQTASDLWIVVRRASASGDEGSSNRKWAWQAQNE